MIHNPNQHIIDELENFRQKPGKSFYALQVNAPWGAGKSHFIRTYLDKIENSGHGKEIVKNLHITLFGAESIEDLERQVISQLFSSSSRIVGTLISTAISGVAGFFQTDRAADRVVDEARESILVHSLQQVRGGLVVFDDVERSRMPLKNVLGYINRFVEVEGFKVIIISNEEVFYREDASDEEKINGSIFRSFKEKLIGRTLRLTPDPENAYLSFVKEMADCRAKTVATKEASAALHLFKASGRENLRSLRIGVEAFDRLAKALEPKILASDLGLREIMLACLYIAGEHAGAADISVISNPYTVALTGRLSQSDSDSTKPSKSVALAKDVIQRYGELIDFRTPTVPFEFLTDFIARGVLHISKINAAACISPLVAHPKDIPSWRLLIDIWNFDEHSLPIYTADAISKFEKLEIINPGEILHLAGIMLWREARGDLSLSGGCTPFDFVQDYLDRLRDGDKDIEQDFHFVSLDRFSAYGYMVLGASDHGTELIKISNLIQISIDLSVRKNFPVIRMKLLSALAQPDRDLKDIGNGDDEFANYLRMPIFEDSEPGEFVNLMLKDNRFDHSLLRWLCERYERYQNHAALQSEREWLRALYNELKARVCVVPPPLNVFWAEAVDARILPLLSYFSR